MKKVIMILLALFAASAFAWALDGSATFYWYPNDDNVAYYRYQLDSEDPAKWTVVDSWTNEATLDFIDVSVAHAFYLQQSYDGETWSESSVVYSEIVEAPAEEVPAETDNTVIDEPENNDVVDEPAPEQASAEETPAEEAAPVEEKKKEKTGFLMDIGAGYRDTLPSLEVPRTVGLNLSATSLFARMGFFEIGVKGEFSFYATPDIINGFAINKLYLGADALAVFNFNIGDKTDIYLGFGAGAASQIKMNSYIYGLTGELGVRYFFADKFGIGVECTARKSMYETRDYTMLDAKLYLSFRN